MKGTLFEFNQYPTLKSIVVLNTGSRLMAADFQVCTSRAAFSGGYLDLAILDSQNREFRGSPAADWLPLFPELRVNNLGGGDCVRGWVAFEISATSPGPFRIRWAPSDGDSPVTWMAS
jgi:hypothetical protein